MADTPDIIIRTAEEREAEEREAERQAEAERKVEYPCLLAEVRYPWGVRIREAVDLDRWSPLLKHWRFANRESLHLFAAALVRNYRREGVRATRNHCSQYEHCYDNRTEARSIEHIESAPLLEW